MSVEALYRGHLAKVTENMGNPHAPTPIEEIVERLPWLRDEPSEAAGIWQRWWDMDGAVLDDELWVSFADPDLIIEPSQAQVDEAGA